MKTLAVLALTIFISYAAASQSVDKEDSSPHIIRLPANKGFLEPYKTGEWNRDIPQAGADNFTQKDVTLIKPDKSLVWYYSIKPGTYKGSLDILLPKGNQSKFSLTISAVDDAAFKPRNFKIEVTGTGSYTSCAYGSFTIANEAWYRIALTPETKDGPAYGTISWHNFQSTTKNGGVRFSAWQSSPSVHLSFGTDEEKPARRRYSWVYGEITVPAGKEWEPSYDATYWMSLGFWRGYFGIQPNRVLFSVWNSSNEGVDPGKVNDSNKVKLVAKGKNVRSNEFGNEGTGGQTSLNRSWKYGKPVKFLLNAKPLPDNSVVISAWFNDTDNNKEWYYMASWKAPQDQRMFDGYYSFLENFDSGNGQYKRKGIYSNGFGFDAEALRWIEFNKVRISNTDGLPRGRNDYNAGVDPENPSRFIMESGGYQKSPNRYGVISKKTGIPPKVNLDSLSRQIDNLLAKFNRP